MFTTSFGAQAISTDQMRMSEVLPDDIHESFSERGAVMNRSSAQRKRLRITLYEKGLRVEESERGVLHAFASGRRSPVFGVSVDEQNAKFVRVFGKFPSDHSAADAIRVTLYHVSCYMLGKVVFESGQVAGVVETALPEYGISAGQVESVCETLDDQELLSDAAVPIVGSTGVSADFRTISAFVALKQLADLGLKSDADLDGLDLDHPEMREAYDDFKAATAVADAYFARVSRGNNDED